MLFLLLLALVLLTFACSAFYVLKNGRGPEKLLCLFPVGTFFGLCLAWAFIFQDEDPSPRVDGLFDFGVGVALILACGWSVTQVRNGETDRALREARPRAAATPAGPDAPPDPTAAAGPPALPDP